MNPNIHKCILTVALLICSAIFTASVFAQTISYSYDAAGRLVSVSYSNGASIKYEYDAAGNITKITYGGASLPSKATLISPSGTINTNKPTYKWNNEPSATYYQLYVNDSTSKEKMVLPGFEWVTPIYCGSHLPADVRERAR
jgi:YD repeat-containing protein